MNLTCASIFRLGACAVVLALAVVAPQRGGAIAAPAHQDATPTPVFSCDAVTPVASPAMGEHGMAIGTPAQAMAAEFDQLYIDMMIPHHQSIIALAQVALPGLTDERLRTIAQNIVAAQSAEIEELRGYRQQFYGSAEPTPMDDHVIGMMMQAMPTMGSMDDMATRMDPEAQVAAFCAAADPDLAFIDQTIPHHEMAIVASETALTQATHQEIKDFAQRVIDAQQNEVDELTQIRQELTGQATPGA
jgi:uncharacterized protein (DUF305 family)